MENKTRRMCFNINGLLGGILATLLLLAILGVLTYLAIDVQQKNATNYYEIQDPTSVQANSVDNAGKRVNK
ncbi:MAG TPA: DUF4006 family protein [Campylobacterales bacterium]|nr:DUF4006 family protein [Campylobacterales bacterium]